MYDQKTWCVSITCLVSEASCLLGKQNYAVWFRRVYLQSSQIQMWQKYKWWWLQQNCVCPQTKSWSIEQYIYAQYLSHTFVIDDTVISIFWEATCNIRWTFENILVLFTCTTSEYFHLLHLWNCLFWYCSHFYLLFILLVSLAQLHLHKTDREIIYMYFFFIKGSLDEKI